MVFPKGRTEERGGGARFAQHRPRVCTLEGLAGVPSRRRSVRPGSLPSEVGPPVSSEQGQRQGDAPRGENRAGDAVRPPCAPTLASHVCPEHLVIRGPDTARPRATAPEGYVCVCASPPARAHVPGLRSQAERERPAVVVSSAVEVAAALSRERAGQRGPCGAGRGPSHPLYARRGRPRFNPARGPQGTRLAGAPATR